MVMIKNILCVTILLFVILSGKAQNVGQEGDSLINYIDINGLKQGHWLKKYPNGNAQYEAYFVDNKPIGKLKRFDKAGDLYAILNYDKKSEYASSEFFHKSGKTLAKGKYYGNLKDSIWLYWDDNGKLYAKESWVKGIKNGTFIQYTSEGNILEEITWKQGLKDGPWKKYYGYGPLLFEASYVQGKLEGTCKSYYASGILQKEVKYINDLMEGPCFLYKENGSLQKIYSYKHGVCAELMDEQDKMIIELEKNKDQVEDPAEHINDPTWLKQ
jgi:antitoxin component YwqK of YwqJK toxin-antitoxin module